MFNVIEAAKNRKVSVLILLGPFLDESNEILKDGHLKVSDKEEYNFEQF